ncbi:MAG: DUF4291 domain-containing protein [Puniceicoccales bacterium]|nr:DUF4291 domain-containing protein [Puniceicoccales bacterium]
MRSGADGFEWVLENAALYTYNHSLHGSDQKWEDEFATKYARVQWDPERDWKLDMIEIFTHPDWVIDTA